MYKTPQAICLRRLYSKLIQINLIVIFFVIGCKGNNNFNKCSMFSIKKFKIDKEIDDQCRWTEKHSQNEKLRVKGGRMTDEQPGI